MGERPMKFLPTIWDGIDMNEGYRLLFIITIL